MKHHIKIQYQVVFPWTPEQDNLEVFMKDLSFVSIGRLRERNTEWVLDPFFQERHH